MQNLSEFDKLPNEILIWQIIYRLPIETINSLCTSSKRFSYICRDENIWKQKVLVDFPGLEHDKANDISWRDFYILLLIQQREQTNRRRVLLQPAEYPNYLSNIPDSTKRRQIRRLYPYPARFPTTINPLDLDFWKSQTFVDRFGQVQNRQALPIPPGLQNSGFWFGCLSPTNPYPRYRTNTFEPPGSPYFQLPSCEIF